MGLKFESNLPEHVRAKIALCFSNRFPIDNNAILVSFRRFSPRQNSLNCKHYVELNCI